MTPHAVTEIPVSEARVPQVVTHSLRPVSRVAAVVDYGRAGRPILGDALLENHHFKSFSKTLDLLIALALHATVIAIPIFAGLYFTHGAVKPRP